MTGTLRDRRREQGMAMAALLVSMSVMAIMLGAALPVWQTYARREKEAELIFRGEQYARAISLFQRKYANSNPPNVDLLVKERFLRKKYTDPITGGDFDVITPTTELPGRSTPLQLQRNASGSSERSSSRIGSTESRTSGARETSALPGRAAGGGARGRSGAEGTRGRGLSVTRTGSAVGARGLQAGATTGIMGVMSKSTEKSFRVYNGGEHYNEWIFMATAASNRAGAPSGGITPGIGEDGARSGGARGRGAEPQRGRGGRSGVSPSRGLSSLRESVSRDRRER